MGDEMNHLIGKGVLIYKKTGQVMDIGKVTIKELHLGELEPGDERIELRTPSFFDCGKTITFKAKVRSKRKLRKLLYKLNPPIPMNRKYISKREMIRAINKISEEVGVGSIMESDEQLMRYSAKHLYAIFMHLYEKRFPASSKTTSQRD